MQGQRDSDREKTEREKERERGTMRQTMKDRGTEAREVPMLPIPTLPGLWC